MELNGVCHRNMMESSINCDQISDTPKAGNLGSAGGYRPRGSLARTLYEKQKHDDYLSRVDKMLWYQCDLKKLPEELSFKFVQLEPDDETMSFLKQSEDKSDWILLQLWHSVAKALLGWFMTQTSINGWLRRGSMFVLSTGQFLKLLGVGEGWRRDSLLDLGAGDGEVTARIASLFETVYATEMSATMRGLLTKKGYKLLDIDEWHQGRQYDVISALNLIDRCNQPMQLLKDVKRCLKPDGLLLLAVVLPFSPYVEFGSKSHKPKELLPITGKTFEDQVASIDKHVFKALGFNLVSWSRVPYLCEGDLHQSYYWLDDAIFILKIADP